MAASFGGKSNFFGFLTAPVEIINLSGPHRCGGEEAGYTGVAARGQRRGFESGPARQHRLTSASRATHAPVVP
jgi:hypothetical protein